MSRRQSACCAVCGRRFTLTVKGTIPGHTASKTDANSCAGAYKPGAP